MTDLNPSLESTQDRRDVISSLNKFSPEFVGMISKFCIGEVYERDILNEHSKEIVALVALISLGSPRLKGHFESSLNIGMSKEALSEIVMLSAIYLGFPRAIDAMLVLQEAYGEYLQRLSNQS